MLKDILPAKWRGIVYVSYALAGLILGAIQVGYSAAAVGQPVWLVVAFPVFAFLGAGLGFTANANTPTGEHVAKQ